VSRLGLGRWRREHRVLVFAVMALGLAGLAVLGTRSSAGSAVPRARTGLRLAGTFTLFSSSQPQAKPCASRPGYSDIAAGAPVVVRDERGVTVATAPLSSGTSEPSRRGCVFRFRIQPLPVAAAYTVSVGRRGGLRYSYADLQNAGWRVTMGLGAVAPK